MGQLFDRISRIAKSYMNQSDSDNAWAENVLDADADELRKIIDELNREPLTNHQQAPHSKRREIPPSVVEAFRVLGIDVDATSNEVKTTYRRLIAQWHPDKFVNASATEQLVAAEKSKEINAAYVIVKAYLTQQ